MNLPVFSNNPSPPDSDVLPRGRVKSELPFRLDRRNPISIGSAKGCDIVIEGAAPRHAELHWDNVEGGWWVNAIGDTALPPTVTNDKPAEEQRLEPGNVFEVAGVRIRYEIEGKCLQEANEPPGLRVTVRNMRAEVKRKLLWVFPGERKRLLDNITFGTEPGRFVAILGPSGCGKSTLIQRMAGLADYGGNIRLNGREVSEERDILQPLVAYLPQAVEDTFHSDMTVEAEMMDFSRVYLGGKSSEEWNAGEMFRLVDLDWEKLRGKTIRELSGGQKRRLALVVALLRDPRLLLLDEPTAGLDPASEEDVMHTLQKLARQQGRTVFCTTHVLGRLDLCDEVLVLAPGGDNGGRQAFYGTAEQALKHFRTDSWLEVYRQFERGEWNPARTEPQKGAESLPLPKPSSLPPFRAVFRGTFLRLLRESCQGWNLALFAGVPFLVAVVLAWACGAMFGEDGDTETVCFCMAVAVFWLGLSGSVQRLVSERVPKRCLDRMRGMPLGGYFAAHAVFALAEAVLRATLFTFIVFLWRHNGVCFSSCAAPAFAFVLSLTAFAGACVGLSVGAGVGKELHAVRALPAIAILALFLSKPVLGGAPDGRALQLAERAMPTYHAQECLSGELEKYRLTNPNPNGKNWVRFLLFPATMYPLLGLSLAWVLQDWRERQWDGR